MESSAGAAFLERKSAFWFVAALAIVLFAITNLPWHLDEYDQAKQAFTSFEMVKQGHWIYQHTPNGVSRDKATTRRLDLPQVFLQ